VVPTFALVNTLAFLVLFVEFDRTDSRIPKFLQVCLNTDSEYCWYLRQLLISWRVIWQTFAKQDKDSTGVRLQPIFLALKEVRSITMILYLNMSCVLQTYSVTNGTGSHQLVNLIVSQAVRLLQLRVENGEMLNPIVLSSAQLLSPDEVKRLADPTAAATFQLADREVSGGV